MQMKEARAGVDGRDFQKIVSAEKEEEGFLAREGIVFSAGAGEGHVCARRKCCGCFEIYYVVTGYMEHATRMNTRFKRV